MATKKEVKPSTKATAPGTAIVDWKEEMARRADAAAAITGTASGQFIGLKNGIISVDKTPVPGNKLQAVVLAHIFENALYEGKYDPDNPAPPVCFAFGTAEDDMVPHELSTNPQGLSEQNGEPEKGESRRCKTCWANQWASADQGTGKACKNIRRLGLIAGDESSIATAESIAEQKVHYLKTPVTSSKFWDAHVKDVAKNLRMPPLGVVTTITSAPDGKTQFRLIISVGGTIETAEQFEALTKKAATVEQEITFPYQPKAEETAPPARAAASRNNKFASKKPVGRGK